MRQVEPVPTHADTVIDSVRRVLERHLPTVTSVGRPACEYCAEAWPCPSALAAQQAVVMAGGVRPALAGVPRPRTGEHS
jgi:hypothetical protein